MRRVILVGALGLLLAGGMIGCATLPWREWKPLAPPALAYVDTVFALMQEHLIPERAVDWNELRRRTLRRASGARVPAETYDALQWALKEANPHSFMIFPELWARMERESHENPRNPTGQLLPGDIGYIALPGITSTDSLLILAYVRAGHELVRQLGAQGACGWILDLRSNTGGNVYTMILAAGPLLGEGPAGFFRAFSGLIRAFGYNRGAAWVGTDTMVRLPPDVPPTPPVHEHVAVLTGPVTSSSGEALVVAFRGLPNVVSFGAPTAGYSTANTGYRLSDGAIVLLTELVVGDRTAQEYGKEVHPDIPIGGPITNLRADPADPWATRFAARWLRSQPECKEKPERAGRR